MNNKKKSTRGKLKVKVKFADNISKKEEDTIWRDFFDILFKEKKSRSNSKDINRIIKLSNIFSQYKIYPVGKYISGSPVRCFQRLFHQNYYTSQIETFLQSHAYKPVQRGADLPWWGSKYFTDESGHRVMIISQDSLAKDAGSIVFWSCLYSLVNSEEEYSKFTQCLGEKKTFRFNSWKKIYDQLSEWNIDLQFCYITDASKVYKEGSWKDGDFDKIKSKKLLEEEIEYCKPDLLILLGSAPLAILDKNLSYRDVVGTQIDINGFKCIVSTFLTGNALAQPNFKNRLKEASELIISKTSDSE